MAYLVSDTGVAVVTLEQDLTDSVMSFQVVGETVFLDIFEDFASVKDGNPSVTYQVSTEDLKSAYEAIGIS